MGTARSLQQDPRDWEIPAQGPPQRAGGPAPSAATLRALILALLWRGSLSQEPGYSLWVPQAVSVQEGLCVRLPCTFQYPEKYDRENPGSQLYRHWYKGEAQVGSDPPVASSDPRRVVSQETRGRFRLVVDPALGNCSLQISDARRTDEGSYFLRVQRAEFRYSYRSTTRPPYYSFGYTEPRLSVLGLTEQPEIQTSPVRGLPGELLAGEPVTVTCTAPGRCSGTPPRVTWTGPFNDTARDVSARLENGSWAYSSALSFTPTAGDHGQNLTCTVTYSSAGRPATSRTIRLRIAYAGGSGKLLGAGVACGVGVALGFFLLGLWVIRRRGRGPEPPSAETGQMANGSQGQHTADIPSLIYCNVTPLPVEHKPPATRQSRGVQGAPLSPGEPEELHYAAIDLTKLQHPEGEPPPAPKSEYSEIWRK